MPINYAGLQLALGRICPHCCAQLDYTLEEIDTKQGRKVVCRCKPCGKLFRKYGLPDKLESPAASQPAEVVAPKKKWRPKKNEGGRDDRSATTKKTKQRDAQTPALAKSRRKKDKREEWAPTGQ